MTRLQQLHAILLDSGVENTYMVDNDHLVLNDHHVVDYDSVIMIDEVWSFVLDTRYMHNAVGDLLRICK